jgi:hypothetical protein
MNIEFGVLNVGRLTLASDGPLPDVVKRVEYYREQQLFMLVYDNDNAADSDGSALMECEVPSHLAAPIEKSPNIVIFTIFEGLDPLAYKVPLIKVGDVF